jgi:hypothetical protein
MDPSAFDTLAHAVATTGTRRRLMTLLAALPLGGALTIRGAEEAAAERPIDRVQRRTKQRNRKQRNQRSGNNNNQNNNNGGGGGGGNGGGGDGSGGGGGRSPSPPSGGLGSPAPCLTNGVNCQQNSQCCSGNCPSNLGFCCLLNGTACTGDDDCCSLNCFNDLCADPVTQCGGTMCPFLCHGCAGTNCCCNFNHASCGDTCC